MRTDHPYFALGLEGSANKLGAGVIRHDKAGVTVLSNVRHTYITPPGEGFQPRDTAVHHREWALKVISDAMTKARLSMRDVDCICYTKGASRVFAACLSRSYERCRAWYGCTTAISRIGCTNVISPLLETLGWRESLRRACVTKSQNLY